MNYTHTLKKEILENPAENSCCKCAGLSAYIKALGTFFTLDGNYCFSIYSEYDEAFEIFSQNVFNLYGIKPVINRSSKRVRADYSGETATKILVDAGIIEIDNGGYLLKLSLDKYLVENDCCKATFIKWAFLASGAMSVPDGESKSGYHLEFSFSNYAAASDFCELLSYFDLMPKTVERNGYVVYFNNVKEILDLLFVMDAKKCMIELKTLYKQREVNNNINRQMNCEISNISKRVNASIEHRKAIEKIDKTIGLNCLKKELQDVCRVRMEDPNGTMEQLAEALGITKSCLNHRLRKIMAISNQI